MAAAFMGPTIQEGASALKHESRGRPDLLPRIAYRPKPASSKDGKRGTVVVKSENPLLPRVNVKTVVTRAVLSALLPCSVTERVGSLGPGCANPSIN